MTSTAQATRQALELRLQSVWTSTEIEYEDVPFTKPVDRPWVRATMVRSVTEPKTVGATMDKSVGMFALDVFAPRSQPGGLGEAERIADELAPLFRCQRLSGVLTRVPTISKTTLPPEDPYVAVKVLIPWERQDFA